MDLELAASRRPRRIAFVTDEFPSESPDAGGLASYLGRITRVLHEQGHEVEVLTRTSGSERVLDWHGVRVESVRPEGAGRQGFEGLLTRLQWRAVPGELAIRLRTALALARVFAWRDNVSRFDWVQSSSCGLSGLFLRRRPGLRHLVRMSSIRDAWLEADGVRPGLVDRLIARLEASCARRADVAYAPSRYLAERLRHERGLDVAVLRPPALQETKLEQLPSLRIPQRYLLHFGNIQRRKGSELLAAALPRAWQREPELTLLWAGRSVPPALVHRLLESFGEGEARVRWLGALPRSALLPIVARARASVLPSLADNLPNTAIESLCLGVPVIALRGASLDELVEDGASGALTAADPEALADALVQAWRGEARWIGEGFRRPAALQALHPDRAARELLALADGAQPG